MCSYYDEYRSIVLHGTESRVKNTTLLLVCMHSHTLVCMHLHTGIHIWTQKQVCIRKVHAQTQQKHLPDVASLDTVG